MTTVTATDQRTIAVLEDDLRDWIEELRAAAYELHRRHPGDGSGNGVDFCSRDICRAVTSVTNAMEQHQEDRSSPRALPEPPKPRARRPRKSTGES